MCVLTVFDHRVAPVTPSRQPHVHDGCTQSTSQIFFFFHLWTEFYTQTPHNSKRYYYVVVSIHMRKMSGTSRSQRIKNGNTTMRDLAKTDYEERPPASPVDLKSCHGLASSIPPPSKEEVKSSPDTENVSIGISRGADKGRSSVGKTDDRSNGQKSTQPLHQAPGYSPWNGHVHTQYDNQYYEQHLPHPCYPRIEPSHPYYAPSYVHQAVPHNYYDTTMYLRSCHDHCLMPLPVCPLSVSTHAPIDWHTSPLTYRHGHAHPMKEHRRSPRHISFAASAGYARNTQGAAAAPAGSRRVVGPYSGQVAAASVEKHDIAQSPPPAVGGLGGPTREAIQGKRNSKKAKQTPPLGPIAGRVFSLSCSSAHSIALQNLMKSDDAVRVLVFKELSPHFAESMCHQFSNYLCHQLFACSPPDAQIEMLEAVSHHLSESCRDVYGYQAVQNIISNCPSNSRQASIIVSALSAHVSSLCVHRHGNFVIQRCMRCFLPDKTQNILDVVIRNCATISKDEFGNRVVQTCIKCARGDRRVMLIRALLTSARELIMVGANRPQY